MLNDIGCYYLKHTVIFLILSFLIWWWSTKLISQPPMGNDPTWEALYWPTNSLSKDTPLFQYCLTQSWTFINQTNPWWLTFKAKIYLIPFYATTLGFVNKSPPNIQCLWEFKNNLQVSMYQWLTNVLRSNHIIIKIYVGCFFELHIIYILDGSSSLQGYWDSTCCLSYRKISICKSSFLIKIRKLICFHQILYIYYICNI